MNVRGRVERLERGQPDGGELCTCQPPRVVYGNSEYAPPDAQEPGPELCPHCGRKRVTLRVDYGGAAKAIAEAMNKGGGDDETAQERTLRTLGEALAHMNGDADQTDKTDERG